MSKPTHTPGPWKLGRRTAKGRVYIDAPGWWRFAKVIVQFPCSQELTRQGEANARLIAAAPDLLAAAKAVLDGGFAREDSEYADALFECLRQVIAKAEGA